MSGSTYSQKAYPRDMPVTASLTKLKAFKGPNAVNSSLTLKSKVYILGYIDILCENFWI